MTFWQKYWMWFGIAAVVLSIVSLNPGTGIGVMLIGAIAAAFVAARRRRAKKPAGPVTITSTSSATPKARTVTVDPRREPTPPPASSPSTPIQLGPPYELLGVGNYANTETEGEFARIDAIARVVGGTPAENEEVVIDRIPAALVPEPRNRYDKNAVMVVIDGEHVGYLPRQIAAEYAPHLASIAAAGYTPLTWARIWLVARHNWETRRMKLHANVRVALGEATRLAPINNPPERAYSLLPWGGAVQVTGEERYLEVLTEHLNPDRPVTAIGTLHEQAISGRGTLKSIVEVCIDGETIGNLTPQMSQNFLPAIRHLREQGLATAAWLTVKGSALAVQVTVQAPKAHDLPSEWLARAHTVPSLYPRGRGAAPVDRPAPMWDD